MTLLVLPLGVLRRDAAHRAVARLTREMALPVLPPASPGDGTPRAAARRRAWTPSCRRSALQVVSTETFLRTEHLPALACISLRARESYRVKAAAPPGERAIPTRFSRDHPSPTQRPQPRRPSRTRRVADAPASADDAGQPVTRSAGGVRRLPAARRSRCW